MEYRVTTEDGYTRRMTKRDNKDLNSRMFIEMTEVSKRSRGGAGLVGRLVQVENKEE